MMAAATPAMKPEVHDTPIFAGLDMSSRLVGSDLYMAISAVPCTANFAIVYGICLKRIGTNPEYQPARPSVWTNLPIAAKVP